MSNTFKPSPTRILEVGSSFWACRVLLTAVECELFTLLGEGPATALDLNRKLGFQPRPLYDFLDALLSLGFLERDGDGAQGRYRNTPDTAEYLDKRKPQYVGGLLEMFSTRLFGYWNDLPGALRTGTAQSEVKHTGRTLFESVYTDPDKLEQMMSAMRGVSAQSIQAAVARLDMSGYRTLCDIGGATGQLAVAFAERHPHLSCMSFDLPPVEPIARRWIARSAAADRVATVSGDFLKDPLPSADVITMSEVLHDWSLDKKRYLIRQAYHALPIGGAFIAIECLIDDARRRNSFGLLMSLNMLIECGDAFDFTGAEFADWCREAGFGRCEIVHLGGASSAAIAYK
jgi:hypothetical protein